MNSILKFKLIFTVVLAWVGVGLDLAQAQNKQVVVIPLAGDDVTSEARTPISSVPIVISSPGSYYFTGNLAHTDKATIAIQVNADHVTLDMMGFVLTGPGNSTNSQPGIFMNGRRNITIVNGTVREFGHVGIYEQSLSGRSHRMTDLRVIDNKHKGISLGGANHQVRSCTAQGNGKVGISTGISSLLVNNTAAENGSSGIEASTGSIIINNTASSNQGSGIGGEGENLIEGNTVHGNNLKGLSFLGGIIVGNDSRVVGNVIDSNSQNGIYFHGIGSILEGNHVSDSLIGINFNAAGKNAYRNNTAAGNTTAYGGTYIASAADGGGNLDL